MDKSRLDDTLKRLDKELERAQTHTDEQHKIRRDLRDDIRAVLDEPNEASRASLRTRLETAVTHFEDSHPELTLLIKQALDHLAAV